MNRLKRTLAVVLVFLVAMTAFALPAFAKVGDTYFNRRPVLRLRTKPGSKNVVVTLAKGDVVKHMGSKSGWWKVKTVQGLVGYVYPSNLKTTDRLIVKDGLYHVYRIEKLAVRQGPSAKALKLGTLPRGTAVKLRERRGDWGGIELANGNTGWVKLKYLKYIYNHIG